MPPSTPAASPQIVITPTDCTETLLSDSSSSPNSPASTTDLCTSLSTPTPEALEQSSPSSRSSIFSESGSVTLNRIEFLEVTKKVKRDGVSYYVVDVYQQRSEHLQRVSDSAYNPTIAATITGSDLIDFMLNEREPDYHVEHRFADFRELKNALQVVAQQHADQCVHCQTLHAYLTHSDNQSWTVKRILKSSSSRQELLSKFINGVLSLTSESDSNNRLCLANDQVLEMIEAFLKRRYEVSLGII